MNAGLGGGASTLVVVALFGGAGMGCGGDALPAVPAHSASFYPVRGTSDTGGPVQTLTWRYRINGGQAVPYASVPASTIHYGDQTVTASGSVMTHSTQGTLSPTSAAGTSGSVSTVTTDHLSGDSPATILERDVDARATVMLAGQTGSSHVMLGYAFSATPMATFFDRADLDGLPLGFAQSQQVGATATGTVSTTNSSGTQSQSVSTTLTLTQSWTLREQLPTFQVLGRDYANVVVVESVTIAEPANEAPTQDAATFWLAKGIGLIRGDDVVTQSSGTEARLFELVETNLVVP